MTSVSTPYSVTQLNRLVKQLLGEHFWRVRVMGEISNLSSPSSGHLYFSLKDDFAQVRCAMFKPQRQRATCKPRDGQQVIVSGQLSLYEPRGDYQLIVESMEEVGTGVLQQSFEKLKTKLLAEGLFEAGRKRQIPALPGQVGVITSPSGAAIHDVLTVLRRRFPAIPVVIYPVAVQGEAAKGQICQALATANRQGIVDVILLARGGGSLEDLWAFNEEVVARAIAASQIPVISAVGHETDFTIADFVADLRAPTPSAAAEFAVPDHRQWLKTYAAIEQRLAFKLKQLLENQRLRLDWLEKNLKRQHPGEKLQRNAQRVDELEGRLLKAMQRGLQNRISQLAWREQRLKQTPWLEQLHQSQQAVTYLDTRLLHAMHNKLAKLQQQQAGIAQTLHAVSPLATLERGYAIVQQQSNEQLVKSVSKIKIGESLRIRFANGSVIGEVKEIAG